jgi:uncharacterized protein (TIGR00725 family)
MRRYLIGVMGGGEVSDEDLAVAYELGRLVAKNGWVVLNGGSYTGVADASARGAGEAGGLAVGILSDDNCMRVSGSVDIAIVTGMGSARNNISVLSSDVIIVCSGASGTLSEIALALKAGRRFIVLRAAIGKLAAEFAEKGQVVVVDNPTEAIEAARKMLPVRE